MADEKHPPGSTNPETTDDPNQPNTDHIHQGDVPDQPQDITRLLESSDEVQGPLDAGRLVTGMRLGDFQIVERLGRGAFATVYLAIQCSLGRQVALKVSRKEGGEAQALASLEHEHIVRVHSEQVHASSGLQLICMQFVSGSDLDRILRALEKHPREAWDGQLMLEALDELCRHPAMFDPAALRDREHLSGCDLVGAVCWLGARVAEGLAHAHKQGVLHQDIKPANIMLNRYGRPLLSDFNMARTTEDRKAQQGSVGGTLRYMSPEHLEAFNPRSQTNPDAVDERSDIYSLGLVIFELLAGRAVLQQTLPRGSQMEVLDQLARRRREAPLSTRTSNPTVPLVLDRVIQRCLDPDPAERYQRAEDLVEVLEGCQELQSMHAGFPEPSWLSRLSLQRPVLMTFLMIMVPQMFGSIVNITYNSIQIVGSLTGAQQQRFIQLVILYNLIAYPLGFWILARNLVPIVSTFRRVRANGKINAEEIRGTRRLCLNLPARVVTTSCLLWLPGGLFFPLGLGLSSDAILGTILGPFLFSFTISGLIVTTYSYFGAQFLMLRVFYPELWMDPVKPGALAKSELQPIEGRVRIFQVAAGLIPLLGAALLLGSESGNQFTLGYRLLIIGLIGLGMMGFGLTILVGARLTRSLNALIGSR